MRDESLAHLLAYIDKNPHGVNVTIIRPKSEKKAQMNQKALLRYK